MRGNLGSLGLLVSLFAALASACSSSSSGSSSATAGTATSTAAAEKPKEALPAPERAGGALMRSADGARLYLADEDHQVLRVLPLPFGEEPPMPKPTASASASASASAAPSGTAAAGSASPSGSPSGTAGPRSGPSGAGSYGAPPKPTTPPRPAITPGVVPTADPYPPTPQAKQIEIPLPGRPAQVMALEGFVLVTIRDPGMLLVLKETAESKLEEEGRVPLAADAWGVAITKDEKVAVVTSAWTHTVTGVDWRAHKVLWTADVPREPRGVVIHPNGKTAYVSHLTSGDLTRIDDVGAAAVKVTKVPFPAAPARTPQGQKLEGSLGYALVIDDAGNRLFAARHALGALGDSSWFGEATVDVLQTANDQPLLGPRTPGKIIGAVPAFTDGKRAALERNPDPEAWENKRFTGPEMSGQGPVQPRAMVASHKRGTLWVASEGHDSVEELSQRSAAPAERWLRSVHVGRHYRDLKIIGSGSGDSDGIPTEGGAPTGLAMSADESILYVYCRSTNDVVSVRVNEVTPEKEMKTIGEVGAVYARVAADSMDEAMTRGRRLFLGGMDGYSSGGMGCAGCHPEGRDDGHVWHDVVDGEHSASFMASQFLADKTKNGARGYARQTPMLAGRVGFPGPYGWHAQSENLAARLAEGFNLHRWNGRDDVKPSSWMLGVRAAALAEYLRKGLVTPPVAKHELTAQEKKGKELFESDATKCKTCHDPETEYGSRIAFPLKRQTPPPGFEDEEDEKFKAPSLYFVHGTAPYYHDGSVWTLKDLIEKNKDRMGTTSQLSAEEKAALVAYLETL
ncbi:MAG: c-type cytochrome [Polyangiaceae bacterium]